MRLNDKILLNDATFEGLSFPGDLPGDLEGLFGELFAGDAASRAALSASITVNKLALHATGIKVKSKSISSSPK
jgi:hypothetical protein